MHGQTREPPTDEALLSGFLAGDARAFESLVGRYANEVYSFVFRFVGSAATAEDVVQETFLQINLSAAGFDASRRFKPWLFTIAANKARDALRSRQRRRETSADAARSDSGELHSLVDWLPDAADGPETQIEVDEQRRIVRAVIDDMPEHLREILLLGYYQRFPYKEIADTLGIPLGTVKSRLHAAVVHFAAAYKRQLEGPSS